MVTATPKLATALALTITVLATPAVNVALCQARKVPVDSLIYDLKNPDPARRREAANALGNNKIQRAVPDLVAAAGDSEPQVRRAVIEALDKMGDMGALPAFVSRAGDPEKDIREKCIDGIVNLYVSREGGLVVTLNKVANFFNPWSDEWGEVVIEPGIGVDSSAVSALQGMLQDPEEGIRQKAVRALGILRGRAAVPAILHSVQEERSNSVRFEAIRSLRKIGDAAVAPELMNYIGYPDRKIRAEAISAISWFHYRPAAAEFARLYERESSLPPKDIDKEYREQLIGGLAIIADPSSQSLFMKEKQSPDDGIRLRAVEGLARIADRSALTEISRDKIREKNPKISTAQAYALYRMGRKEYLEELVLALGSRRTNAEARQYLLELKPEEVPELFSFARRNDVNLREALAEILGLAGDSRATEVLQELSKDSRGQIAPLANQALRRINARTAR